MAFKSSSFLMYDDRWMYRKWAPRMESSPVPLLLPSTRVTHSLIYSLKEDFLCIYCFPRVAAAAKSLQSCLTLCDPMDGSPPRLLSLGFSKQEHWSGLPLGGVKRKIVSLATICLNSSHCSIFLLLVKKSR